MMLNSCCYNRSAALNLSRHAQCFRLVLPAMQGQLHAAANLKGVWQGCRPLMAAAGTTAQVEFEPEKLPSVSVSSEAPASWEGDLLAIGLFQEDVASAEVDEASKAETERSGRVIGGYGGAVGDALALGRFEAKPGTASVMVRIPSAGKAKYLALLGLGPQDKLKPEAEWGASVFQAAGAALATVVKSSRSLSSVAVALPPSIWQTVPAAATASSFTAGVLTGGYVSTRFKSEVNGLSKLERVALLLPEGEVEAAAAAVKLAEARARGILLTKYLVEAPPNVCTPSHLADAAAHVAATSGGCLTLEVLEQDACAAMGMGCYLGVAEASLQPPKFIHLTYTPPSSEVKKKVAVIGKGLTFDSGGYNIKAGAGSMIELMKFDMGGAAATLGAARILAQQQPAGVEVHFIIASCENMVSGAGLRPGDVLTAASGKTVEVNNTDAEGRLTLADAMWFAQEKCGVTAMVDIATLTGACMIALGSDIAGLFTPSDAAAESVSAAAKRAGEKVWRMPMETSYFAQLKSPVADMKNSGGRMGGAITAALFLQKFAREGVEWAHLDIAGPVWDEKEGLPTGFGAALLAEWAAAQGRDAE